MKVAWNNGVDVTTADGDVDSGTGKALAGGVTVRPFAGTRHRTLRGAGVAAGATSGTEHGKSAGAFGEYVRTKQSVTGVGTATDVTNTGWEVTGSFVLRGEAATERGGAPARPFDPARALVFRAQLNLQPSL